MKFVILFVIVAVLAAKIVYDVRKHVNKKRPTTCSGLVKKRAMNSITEFKIPE